MNQAVSLGGQMKTKKFHARTMSEGLKKISAEFGDEAVILSNRRLGNRVEILAGVELPEEQPGYEYEEELGSHAILKASNTRRAPMDETHLMGLLSSIGPLKDQPRPKIQARKKVAAVKTESVKPAKAKAVPVAVKKQQADKRPVNVVSRTDPEVIKMRQEISALRQMLETQSQEFRKLHTSQPEQQDPVRNRLMQFGLSEQVTDLALMDTPAGAANDSRWKHAMAGVAARMKVCPDEIVHKGGMYAFMGLTGAGKTTTLAKLAARFVMHYGPKYLLLVSLDQFRIGAQDTLKNLSRILQCDFVCPDDESSLEAVLQENRHKRKLVLIDTCGSRRGVDCLHDEMQSGLLAAKVRRVLVIPAVADIEGVQQYVDYSGEHDFHSVVFSKVDEGSRLGPAISFVIQNNLAVSYWSDGQGIPEDLHVAKSHQVLSRAVSDWRKRAAERI